MGHPQAASSGRPDAAEGADDVAHFSRRARRDQERAHAHHRRRLFTKILAAAGAIVLLIIGGSAWAIATLNGKIHKADVSGALGTDRPSQASGPSTPLNVLLMGSDTRVGQGNTAYGSGAWEPGAHSDTNLLIHISADRTSAIVVSIPRDSMVPSPVDCSPTQPIADWKIHQWNQNYTVGGPGCVIRTLEGNTGIFVDHYAVVDFNGFKDMVDALGGVEVCTPVAIDDKASKLSLSPGYHTLTGEQALGYVRVRKTLGDGSDLGRIKRQQAFLSSVAQKATSTSLLLRPDKLYGFLSAASSSLTTDPGLDLGTMTDIAKSARDLGVKNIQFVTVPVGTYAPDPNRVEWTASADALWQTIREDRPLNATPSASASASKSSGSPSATPSDLTIAPDRITIEVVNASGVTGLGQSAAEALVAQGFNISEVRNGAARDGVLIEHGPTKRDSVKTVAAAFPGATVEEVAGLGSTIRVTLGAGSPAVATVPQIAGSTSPQPSPSVSFSARSAADDICK